MLPRNAAEQAQRILQAAGQGRVALATQHDLGVLEAGKGEREGVEPMFQRLATDDDAEAIPVGEIGQAHATRLLDLREDDVEVGAVQGFPMGDSPFQGSPERRPDAIGMAPGQFVEEGDRAKAGRGRQKW
jgi:hypothetical protein